MPEPLENYRDRYRHTFPAVILGGGPSLEREYKKTPYRSVRFSVNDHGARLTPCDYSTCYDDFIVPRLKALGPEQTGKIISCFVNHTDILLTPETPNHGRLSSRVAVWLAEFMGCNPIILAGFDCYNPSLPAYYHKDIEPTDDVIHRREQGVVNTVAQWREALKLYRHPERIKVMDGPLMELFDQYE